MDGVIDVLPRLQLQLRTQSCSNTQREALVGPLRSEARTIGLQPLDLTGPIGQPHLRSVIR